MLDYVKGDVAELAPANAVIDCHGVGYMLNISLNTYSAIQGKKECKLFVYEAIREDAHVLFGFATKQERELFLFSERTGECHQHGEYPPAQVCQGYRSQDRSAYHRRTERQDSD